MSPQDVEMVRDFYVGARQHLYTYAVSITGNREGAEDAIHDVFQRLLRLEALPSDLRPFVFRSLRNAAIDTRRRAEVQHDSIFDGPAADNAMAAAPGDYSAAELGQWLQRLTPNERETIVLKVYDQFTFQQIADLRAVPLPTVASWYRRGLEKLRAD